MSEKGGKKVQESESLISLRMVLTTIVGVLLGAIFVLTLIFTGVIVSERYRDTTAKHYRGDKVSDIVAVSYTAKTYDFYPAVDGVTAADDEETDNQEFKTLITMLGGKAEDDYYLIESQTEYDKVVSTLTSLGATITNEDLNLPENFFYSGSIILTTAEIHSLTSFTINSVTRDEYYDLRVDVSKVTDKTSFGFMGKAALIAIPNIQPTNVEVVVRAD